MKKFNKIIALLMATALIVSVFSGCSNPETEIDLDDEVLTTESTVTTSGSKAGDIKGGVSSVTTSKDIWGGYDTGGEKIDKDTVLNYDFKGDEIILYGLSKPDPTKSKAAAAEAEVFEKIQKMNCKIKFVDSSANDTKQKTILNVMSSTHFADIVTTQQHGIVGYLTSDLLHDMGKVKTLDLSQPYMNVGAGVEAFRLGSGYWAVNHPTSLAKIGNYVYFNKRLMKEVTGDENHPYKLMKQGKWNIENWRELNKKGTKELNGDGKLTEADQWGLVFADVGTAGFSAILQANRALMIKNVNGMLSYNMEDGKCIPAIEEGIDLYYRDNTCLNSVANGTFLSGRALFMGGLGADTAHAFADMKDDFGILPYPLGNGQTEYSVCTNWNTTAMAIPASVPKNQISNTGAFLQVFMLLYDEIAVPALFNELSMRYCRDEESKESLMIGYRAQYTTPSAATANDEAVKMGTYRVCYDARSKAPATTVAANKGISIKAIADLNDKLK